VLLQKRAYPEIFPNSSETVSNIFKKYFFVRSIKKLEQDLKTI
jgi:hypothetical protein